MVKHGLIATKVGMTRMVDGEGNVVPATLLAVPMQKITKVLTPERDGYTAIQVGYLAKREKLLTKADTHRMRKVGVDENFARFREFRLEKSDENLKIGAVLTIELFEAVKTLDITGISKGRGFTGAIKRWNASSGPASHGSTYHNRPGSLGMRTTPGRVFKGKHVPGHMGDVRCTVQNLQVLKIDKENGLIAIKGSVPGHSNGYVVIQPSVKLKG